MAQEAYVFIKLVTLHVYYDYSCLLSLFMAPKDCDFGEALLLRNVFYLFTMVVAYLMTLAVASNYRVIDE
jgi:hypothetical protein